MPAIVTVASGCNHMVTGAHYRSADSGSDAMVGTCDEPDFHHQKISLYLP